MDMIANLNKEDQTTVRTERPTSVKIIGDHWFDDHIACVQVELQYNNKLITVSLMWCGPMIIGAAKYANDSEKAMDDLFSWLSDN